MLSTRQLSSGYNIPVIGLGTWKSNGEDVFEAVKKAFEVGYRHIDCAAAYGNENEVGKAIDYALKKYNISRSEIFITSKLWNTKHHSEDVESALRQTLSNLKLEYLDLYLMHWPMGFEQGNEIVPKNADGSVKYDENIHPTDTWFEMEKLVKKNLVRSIGVSNFNSVQLQDLLDKGSIRPVMNQIEVHPYLNQKKLIDYCEKRDVAITAYSPFASPDRPWAKHNESKLIDEPLLKAIGDKINKSSAQILLRWSLQRNCIVIPKSVSFSRILENIQIFDFEISTEDMESISSLECNGRVIVPCDLNGRPRDASHVHYPFNIEF